VGRGSSKHKREILPKLNRNLELRTYYYRLESKST